MLDGTPCIVCGDPVRLRFAHWSARCPKCGSWVSDLPFGGRELESPTRVAGFQRLRRENARTVLDRLSRLRSLDGARLLDVGSAYGWFLEEARARGALAVGIEPDPHVAAHSKVDVRIGLFPDALEPGEQFDVIAFNDVLEHIPDVHGALEACAGYLSPGGLLSVNIPTADGAAYRIACLLARVGLTGPFGRLWQEGLPSPHRHYLRTGGVEQLIESRGFVLRETAALPVVTREGLWARVHTVRRPSPASVVSFVFLYGAAGLLNMPAASDIVHVIGELPAGR